MKIVTIESGSTATENIALDEIIKSIEALNLKLSTNIQISCFDESD